MKLIKRHKNEIYCVEEMKFNIHSDLSELLKIYSKDLDLLPEEIIEYLIDMLRIYKINKEDIAKCNYLNLILVSDEDKNLYKLVKVKDDENLPR